MVLYIVMLVEEISISLYNKRLRLCGIDKYTQQELREFYLGKIQFGLLRTEVGFGIVSEGVEGILGWELWERSRFWLWEGRIGFD